MNEYYFEVTVGMIIFCLYIAVACYLYFVRIPNIQTRTSGEIERDLQDMLLTNLPISRENQSLEEEQYGSLENFHRSLQELSVNIRERSTTV